MASLRNIIDVHSHAILDFGKAAPAARQPDWSVSGALEYMDRHEVAACVVSVPDAANHPQGQEARYIARRVNEKLADMVAGHPTRCGAMACLPGQDMDGAVAELAYAMDTLRMDGVSTSTSINETYLGEATFNPWFEEMNRRGVTLFIHPTITKASVPLSIGMNASVIEFMFDTTRMVTNMVVTGAKQRFSNIKMITTHAGGTIPFLAARIGILEHTFGVGPGRVELSPEEVREGFASFYYDLTAATTVAQLGALLELVPVSQLLMGLDYPFMPDPSYSPAIADIGRYPRFSEADLQSISHGNAGKLYPALTARIDRGS